MRPLQRGHEMSASPMCDGLDFNAEEFSNNFAFNRTWWCEWKYWWLLFFVDLNPLCWIFICYFVYYWSLVYLQFLGFLIGYYEVKNGHFGFNISVLSIQTHNLIIFKKSSHSMGLSWKLCILGSKLAKKSQNKRVFFGRFRPYLLNDWRYDKKKAIYYI